MHVIRNDKGQRISGIKQLLKLEYGSGDTYPNGEPMVNWNLLSKYAERMGLIKEIY